MAVRVGISGWVYPPWRGDFYTAGLPHAQELRYAAERMTSLEINGSFYALQRPSSFYRWRNEVGDVVFGVKAGRFITHMKKLRDLGAAVPNFFASGVLALGDKLGPILWQLPPNLAFDAERMDDFFARLPRSTAEAGYLARRHDERMAGRAWTGAQPDRPLRHAVEVRHDSFTDSAFLRLARDHCITVVTADTAGKWPMILEVTGEFVYVRLHGADELYTSGYGPDGLAPWVRRITQWDEAGLDVYVYFDNDTKVRSPYDAMTLIDLLR